MSKCRIKKRRIIWNALFRAAGGPQKIWYLIIRYSASAIRLKNIFLIKLLYLNSISPQMRSLPLKVLKILRKSQEAFSFRVNLITKLGMSFSHLSHSRILNFSSFSPAQSFHRGRGEAHENTQRLTARIRQQPVCHSAGFRKAPFWIIKYWG